MWKKYWIHDKTRVYRFALNLDNEHRVAMIFFR